MCDGGFGFISEDGECSFILLLESIDVLEIEVVDDFLDKELLELVLLYGVLIVCFLVYVVLVVSIFGGVFVVMVFKVFVVIVIVIILKMGIDCCCGGWVFVWSCFVVFDCLDFVICLGR